MLWGGKQRTESEYRHLFEQVKLELTRIRATVATAPNEQDNRFADLSLSVSA